jgi:Flp pilus assembly protein TadD
MLEEQPDTMLTALDLQLEATSFNGPGFALGPHGPDERMIEQFIRRALTRTQSSEERVPVLTRILADLLQNGRGAVAVALHNRFPDLLPAPRAACGLAAALAVSPAEVLSEQARRQLIQQWLSDHPHDPELRFCVANLQLMRGDYGAAAELLRLCLNDNPAHVGTRNNLAMALAFGTTGQLAEAQELVTKAIQHAGQQPQLLDTLAVLYLRQGAPQNAVDVLLAMLADAPSDGLPLLHLSQAWLELGQTEMARYAFDMARSRHVDLLPLLPPDRLLLQQLDQQLNLE